MSSTILSIENYYSLKCLNKYLKRTTGIDFLKELADLGFNEKKSEIEANNFIKENYPVKKKLSEKDNQNLDLLKNFYLTVVKVYYSTERETSFCVCELKKTPWDDNFRARSMAVFLQNASPFEKSCASTFFPLS